MEFFNEAYYMQEKLNQLHAVGEKDTDGQDYTLETLYKAFDAAGLTAREHYDAYGYAEGLNPSAAFDNNDYLREKLDQLHQTDSKFTMNQLVQALHDAGMSPLQHFEMYGNSEWLSPTAYFDVDDYLEFKAESVYADGTLDEKVQKLTDVLHEVGLTPWDHFVQYGGYEEINPSKEFHIDAYLEDKLAQLRQDTSGYTMDTLKQALVDNGLNALTHYLEFGSSEGLRPTGEYACNTFIAGDHGTGYVLGIDNINFSDFFETHSVYGDTDLTVTGVIGSNIIDSEKAMEQTPYGQDEQKCWAAVASNLLTWTGWSGDFTGTETSSLEDVLFNLFVKNFQYGDKFGSDTQYGVSWFFDGTYAPDDGEIDMPKPGTGDYLGISASPYLEVISPEEGNIAFSDMAHAISLLQKGVALEVGVSFGSSMGHALTCWGYTTNDKYADSDPHHYTGLIISDSDNSRDYLDGSVAPDSLQYLELAWNGKTYVNGGGNTETEYCPVITTITDFVALSPNQDYFLNMA